MAGRSPASLHCANASHTVVLVLAALLAVALLLSGSAAGSAQGKKPNHASVKDKVGDAPAGIDIVSGTYRISKKKAQFTVKVKNLTETTFLAFEIWPLAAAWDRVAVYRENGKTVGKVYLVDNEEETTPYLQRCRGLKVSWSLATDQVSVTVPHRCLQASSSGGANPFEFHIFSRFGGVSNSRTDALPARTLDY